MPQPFVENAEGNTLGHIDFPAAAPAAVGGTGKLRVKQNRLLEMITAGAPLEDCLIALTEVACELHPAARAGVVLAAADGRTVEHVYAAHLPPEFTQAFHGVAIDDGTAGTCCAALHTGTQMICNDIERDPRWSPSWRRLCLSAGLRACLSTPVFDNLGRSIATFFIGFPTAGEPDERSRHLADFGAHLASVAIASKRVTDELVRARQELEEELADTRLLQDISMRLLASGDADSLYREIVDAAATIMQSQFASMQALMDDGRLKLLASLGFDACADEFWKWVTLDSKSTCGEALRTRRRVFVSDLEQCGFMAGSDDLATYRHLGIRAVQTTPLVSRKGQVIGMISTHWHTPREVSEHDLRLFDILVRQAADLVDQRMVEETLKDISRQKDLFLAQLAHELRNPLAPIRNVAGLLKQKYEADPTVKASAEIILRQTGHFARLVDDLLDVSRIEQGRFGLKLEPATLDGIIRHAVETCRPLIDARGQHLDISIPEEPVALEADPVRLAQVFANLLTNASKYSDADGRITLRVERYEDAGGGARVAVRIRDTGIGLAADDIRRLFQLFYQADRSLENSRGGLGVGLFLVRRLVELHHGTVEAQSPGVGQGAEFIVRLPVTTPRTDTGPVAADTAQEAPARRLRILLADDNDDAAESMAEILKLHGHEVAIARDGEQALAQAESWRPDVLLLDIGMPRLSGYAVCERIRREPWGGDTTAIAMSGYGGSADVARSMEAGFDHHFTKPADPLELLRYLATVGKAGLLSE